MYFEKLMVHRDTRARIHRAVITFIGLLFVLSHSHPSRNQAKSITQPDGYTFNAILNGDEYNLHIETVDGYTIIRNDNGYWCYADLDSSGTLVASATVTETVSAADLPDAKHLVGKSTASLCKRSASAAQQSSSVPPLPVMNGKGPYPHLEGDIIGLVILIDFPNQQATVSSAEIDSFFNAANYNTGGVNGSVNKYFKDVSAGLLNYHCLVTPTYYRATENMSYYDRSYSKANELFTAAANWAASSGVDISKLSLNSNGTIRSLNFEYAGSEGSYGLYGSSSIGSYKVGSLTGYAYQYSAIGNTPLPLGIICHETGHMLMGWPDLYDYESPESYGIGEFCLMSYGLYGGNSQPINPVPPNAILRYLAGWTTLESLNSTPYGTQKTITSNDYANVFAYRNSAKAGELFAMEAFQKNGRYAGLPGEGVAIWHADTSVSTEDMLENMTSSKHYMISLEQADGKFEMEKNESAGDSDDLFKSSGVSKFNDSSSTLNSHWWSGQYSGFDVRNIGAPGQTVSFTFGVGTPVGSAVSAAAVPATSIFTRNHTLTCILPESHSDFQIEISSLSGRSIMNCKMSETGNRIEIPISNITSGVYNVNIFVGGKLRTAQRIGYVQ